jgi:hypothetical protein
LPVGKRDKNVIGAKLIFGRIGLPCLPAGRPAYGRQASFVPISKGNKAINAIADINNLIIINQYICFS